MEKIKVAQIIGHMANGGIEAVVFDYFKNIDRNKFEFTFFVEDVPSKIINEETVGELGGKIVYLPPVKKLSKYNKSLFKSLTEEHYDIVHVHMNTLNVFPLRIAKKAKVPVRISHSHTTSNPKEFIRHLAKLLLRMFSHKYATHFVACSKEAGYFQFGKKYVDSNIVKIITNAVDYERFAFNEPKRIEMRKELGSGDKFVIGNVGRLVSQKNQLFLLNVFNEFLKSNPDSTLLLVGNGKQKEELFAKAKKLNIIDHIIHIEGVHNVEDYYQAMDVFAMPSIYEGFGLVALEAQANGLPVVLSNHVPKDAIVNDDVIQLGLKEELWVDALNRIYNDKTKNRLVNREAFKYYDIKNITKELSDYYLNCIN